MSSSPKVIAIAHPNIALIKYWGKRDAALNLPAAGSLSLTLDGLHTTTSVQFDAALHGQDAITFNNEPLSEAKASRLTQFLDLVRARAQMSHGARVETVNDFPTSAGLASSASGFAALALAASRAAGLELDPRELSILSRRGSGSAARSVHGGWVEMLPGAHETSDGADSYAVQLHDASYWEDIRCLVAVCARGPKKLGSTEAMNLTARTAPYYDAWVKDVSKTLDEAKAALLRRDFSALADVAEASCLRMHACGLAARPGILYWKGVTVELMHIVRELRASGTPVFFTIDAGPHIKAFCTADVEDHVEATLRDTPGVLDVLKTRAGQGARLIER